MLKFLFTKKAQLFSVQHHQYARALLFQLLLQVNHMITILHHFTINQLNTIKIDKMMITIETLKDMSLILFIANMIQILHTLSHIQSVIKNLNMSMFQLMRMVTTIIIDRGIIIEDMIKNSKLRNFFLFNLLLKK